MDILVVGAGVQGLTISLELAQRGHSVQLLERETPGSRASWVAAGLLTPSSPWKYPLPLIELAFASEALYPKFVRDLYEQTGIDPEFETEGMIYPIGLEAGEDSLVFEAERRRQRGYEIEQLDRETLDRIVPGMGERIEGALWQPRSSRVRPPRLLRALIRACALAGVHLVPFASVERLSLRRGRVTGVVVGEQALAADRVILAAGAWSAQLAASAGLPLAVAPIRGQMLLLQGRRGALGPTINDGEEYLVPRQDGRILVGSTMEDAGFEAVNTPSALDRLRRRALDLFPETESMKEETHWAGLRPATPDRLPYLGESKNVEGLILACGHFRNGILLAPGTARLVGQLVDGENPLVELSPFSPDRTVGNQRSWVSSLVSEKSSKGQEVSCLP
ncbi:MAG: glycine oxidase ThiO [Planctomycetota bacterium]|nr:glycine oxidase ThiO [Planctomycetota bacterium]